MENAASLCFQTQLPPLGLAPLQPQVQISQTHALALGPNILNITLPGMHATGARNQGTPAAANKHEAQHFSASNKFYSRLSGTRRQEADERRRTNPHECSERARTLAAGNKRQAHRTEWQVAERDEASRELLKKPPLLWMSVDLVMS